MDEPTALLVCLVATAATSLQIIRARRSKARRGFHIVVALVCGYIAVAYLTFFIGLIEAPGVIAGKLVRPAVGVLMVLIAAYAIAYWTD